MAPGLRGPLGPAEGDRPSADDGGSRGHGYRAYGLGLGERGGRGGARGPAASRCRSPSPGHRERRRFPPRGGVRCRERRSGSEDRVREPRREPHRRGDGRASEAEEGEDSRGVLGGDGLLRAGARTIRRARGHPGALGRGARRPSTFGDPRRHRAGRRHEAQPRRRTLDHRRRPGRGGAHRHLGARSRLHLRGEGRRDRGSSERRDRRPGSMPAVHAFAHRRDSHRTLALVDAGSPPRGGHAAHQQRGRHHELRDAGAGPADPRFRLRHHRRASHHRPAGAARGEALDARRKRAELRKRGAPHHRSLGADRRGGSDGGARDGSHRQNAEHPPRSRELQPGERPEDRRGIEAPERGLQAVRLGGRSRARPHRVAAGDEAPGRACVRDRGNGTRRRLSETVPPGCGVPSTEASLPGPGDRPAGSDGRRLSRGARIRGESRAGRLRRPGSLLAEGRPDSQTTSSRKSRG